MTHIVFVENDAKTMHFLCKESVAIGFYDNYEIVNWHKILTRVGNILSKWPKSIILIF